MKNEITDKPTMTDEQIHFTITLMIGSGSEAAESILHYVALSDLPAFIKIIGLFENGSATVNECWDYKRGLNYFREMTFHRMFESAVRSDNIDLLDFLLNTQVYKEKIHFLKDKSDWFDSLLRNWKRSAGAKSRATLDYLILDYKLPFNHHYKKIVESNEDYSEIADMFKSRDLAAKLSKKMPEKKVSIVEKVKKI